MRLSQPLFPPTIASRSNFVQNLNANGNGASYNPFPVRIQKCKQGDLSTPSEIERAFDGKKQCTTGGAAANSRTGPTIDGMGIYGWLNIAVAIITPTRPGIIGINATVEFAKFMLILMES